jgi:hypothetical protein
MHFPEQTVFRVLRGPQLKSEPDLRHRHKTPLWYRVANHVLVGFHETAQQRSDSRVLVNLQQQHGYQHAATVQPQDPRPLEPRVWAPLIQSFASALSSLMSVTCSRSSTLRHGLQMAMILHLELLYLQVTVDYLY